MEEIIFRNLEECNNFIMETAMKGEVVPEWAREQKRKFESVSSETPIYDTLKAHAKFPLTEDKAKCIERTVAKLLEDGPKAEEPGLLLGKIQCGKTDTFENIIGLAFDKGIDIAIILTKGTIALASQTRKRADADYAPLRYTGKNTGKPVVEIYDIMEDIRGGMIKANVDRSKTIIVCKKQTDNLNALTKLFEVYSPFLKEKKVLIVDDEADFASRNYQSQQLKPLYDEDGNIIPQPKGVKMAKISQQIDDFRKVPVYCRYLQVTATPYCLFLQPSGDLYLDGNRVMTFKPRFTSLVPAHDTYIGGKQYFEESENEDSMYWHLFHPVSDRCVEIMGKEDKRYLNNEKVSKYILDLAYAMVSYFMGTAIRVIQEREKGTIYKSSAIVHVEIDKENHRWQRRLIDRVVNDFKKCVVEEDHSDARVWSAIHFCYDDFVMSNEKGKAEGLISVDVPDEDVVINEIRDIFMNEDYHIQIVNSNEQIPLNEDGELKQKATANIFIGGNILDRGITIKNMICFFYGRNPKNFQQDTVLQHARMYGARPKEDMAVTRLHTTDAIYNVLKKMNELDNQLREWLGSGRYEDDEFPTFVGFSKNIKPCAAQKIKASNALTLKPQKRILPVGMWTGTKSEIGKTIKKIDELITSAPGYQFKDEDGFFEIDKGLVVEIISLISQTYVYDAKHENILHKNDLKELLCSLEYSTSKTDGKLWALHRTNRNISRIRENGAWVDAPDDGRTDLEPARRKATNMPVIMLFKENGSKTDANGEPWRNSAGEDIGWNGAEFYWPLLMMQAELPPVMYALEPDRQRWGSVFAIDVLLEGIDANEVLSLRVSEQLEPTYGPEGTIFGEDNPKTFTREIKDSTAKKYIAIDIFAGGELIEKKDAKIPYGVYSFNDGVFPYELRQYRYLLLQKTDTQGSSYMLIELDDSKTWSVYSTQDFNEEGDLVSSDGILLHARDIFVDKNLEETEEQETDVCLWHVSYKLKKVLKYKMGTYNWEAALAQNEE